MDKHDFTPIEQQILERSANPGLTRRRRSMVVIFGIAAAVSLTLVAWIMQSWQFLLVITLPYMGITIVEKVLYANGVLAYKSVIQKLLARIQELEREGK